MDTQSQDAAPYERATRMNGSGAPVSQERFSASADSLYPSSLSSDDPNEVGRTNRAASPRSPSGITVHAMTQMHHGAPSNGVRELTYEDDFADLVDMVSHDGVVTGELDTTLQPPNARNRSPPRRYVAPPHTAAATAAATAPAGGDQLLSLTKQPPLGGDATPPGCSLGTVSQITPVRSTSTADTRPISPATRAMAIADGRFPLRTGRESLPRRSYEAEREHGWGKPDTSQSKSSQLRYGLATRGRVSSGPESIGVDRITRVSTSRASTPTVSPTPLTRNTALDAATHSAAQQQQQQRTAPLARRAASRSPSPSPVPASLLDTGALLRSHSAHGPPAGPRKRNTGTSTKAAKSRAAEAAATARRSGGGGAAFGRYASLPSRGVSPAGRPFVSTVHAGGSSSSGAAGGGGNNVFGRVHTARSSRGISPSVPTRPVPGAGGGSRRSTASVSPSRLSRRSSQPYSDNSPPGRAAYTTEMFSTAVDEGRREAVEELKEYVDGLSRRIAGVLQEKKGRGERGGGEREARTTSSLRTATTTSKRFVPQGSSAAVQRPLPKTAAPTPPAPAAATPKKKVRRGGAASKQVWADLLNAAPLND
eukprot:Rhum_TRINITY_DN12319_c0_g1::Rhum_TRINITY_DN12319_c0_g1_i2::g.51015::m.51015